MSVEAIHNSQAMESVQVPNNWWMKKENVVHVHYGVLFNHKEEWNYVVWRKISETEKDKYSKFCLIYGI
jgi:hypothetical protein